MLHQVIAFWKTSRVNWMMVRYPWSKITVCYNLLRIIRKCSFGSIYIIMSFYHASFGSIYIMIFVYLAYACLVCYRGMIIYFHNTRIFFPCECLRNRIVRRVIASSLVNNSLLQSAEKSHDVEQTREILKHNSNNETTLKPVREGFVERSSKDQPHIAPQFHQY
jgi:hypothetical protein